MKKKKVYEYFMSISKNGKFDHSFGKTESPFENEGQKLYVGAGFVFIKGVAILLRKHKNLSCLARKVASVSKK